MGLEPTHGGTTNLCLNHLATLAMTIYNITHSPKNDQVFFMLNLSQFMTKKQNEKFTISINSQCLAGNDWDDRFWDH